MAATCENKVGDSCDDITCNYGFKKAETVEEFNCTEDGLWRYNLSSLCTGALFYFIICRERLNSHVGRKTDYWPYIEMKPGSMVGNVPFITCHEQTRLNQFCYFLFLVFQNLSLHVFVVYGVAAIKRLLVHHVLVYLDKC